MLLISIWDRNKMAFVVHIPPNILLWIAWVFSMMKVFPATFLSSFWALTRIVFQGLFMATLGFVCLFVCFLVNTLKLFQPLLITQFQHCFHIFRYLLQQYSHFVEPISASLTNPIHEGSNLMTSSNFNHLPKACLLLRSHFRVGFQQINVGRTQTVNSSYPLVEVTSKFWFLE